MWGKVSPTALRTQSYPRKHSHRRSPFDLHRVFRKELDSSIKVVLKGD